MGYTHYWMRSPEFPRQGFEKVVADFRRVASVLPGVGVMLAGPLGSGVISRAIVRHV